MAYFAWKGVDLSGTIRYGKKGARSLAQLDALLFGQDIALLHAKQKRRMSFGTISRQEKNNFFAALSELLSTGVHLPQAIDLVALHTKGQWQELLFSIADDVNHGHALSTAIAKYPDVFSHAMVHMIRVGQESGNLVTSLQLLRDYEEQRVQQNKKLRSALLIPLCTVAFFFVVATIICIFMVPRMATLLQMTGKPLPHSTQMLMNISSALSNWWVWTMIAVAIGAAYVMIKSLLCTQKIRLRVDAMKIRILYVGRLIKLNQVSNYMQSLSLLLINGSPLVAALEHASQGVYDTKIKQATDAVVQLVAQGSSVSNALQMYPDIFDPELIAMIHIGEQTGNVRVMVSRISVIYAGRVQESISTMLTLLQPALMIILGLLISALIFAVYTPVFDLSHAISFS